MSAGNLAIGLRLQGLMIHPITIKMTDTIAQNLIALKSTALLIVTCKSREAHDLLSVAEDRSAVPLKDLLVLKTLQPA